MRSPGSLVETPSGQVPGCPDCTYDHTAYHHNLEPKRLLVRCVLVDICGSIPFLLQPLVSSFSSSSSGFLVSSAITFLVYLLLSTMPDLNIITVPLDLPAPPVSPTCHRVKCQDAPIAQITTRFLLLRCHLLLCLFPVLLLLLPPSRSHSVFLVSPPLPLPATTNTKTATTTTAIPLPLPLLPLPLPLLPPQLTSNARTFKHYHLPATATTSSSKPTAAPELLPTPDTCR